MHSLLKRQLMKCVNTPNPQMPDEWMALLKIINDAYHQFDNDRRMLERSLDLSSRELMQANEDVRAILSAFPDLYFVVDHTGVILQHSMANSADGCFSPQIVLGKRLQDIEPLEVGRIFEEALRKVQQGKGTARIEYWFSAQLVRKYYEARLLPFQEGKIFVVVRDITEQKLAEETIRKVAAENLHLAMAINSVSEGILITDGKKPGNPIIYANPAFTKITGYIFEEIVGRSARFLQGSDTDPKTAQEIADAVKAHKSAAVTILNYRKDGRAFWNELGITPIFSNEGGLLYFVEVQKDVTSRKKIEDELKVMNASLMNNERALRHMLLDLKKAHDDLKSAQGQLVQSEKLAAIGQLAAGIAHEINNPVGFISNNMEILQGYVQDYTKILNAVESIKEHIEEGDMAKSRSAMTAFKKLEAEVDIEYMKNDMNTLLEHCVRGLERIRKIILDLRTFAREDNADTVELLEIESVIESILNIVQSELKYKAELVKDYGKVPLVKCNAQRLGQVFINLLVNAAQAITETGKITIRTYQHDGHVCIDITDTGKGIPPENIKKIFDPFFTTKPVGQGTGLGLSVSYEIIKKYDGKMDVRSKEGEGTTFTVSFPVRSVA